MLGAQDSTGWPDMYENQFDFSHNLLGGTEQQPACSAVSLENLGSCSRGNWPLASRCPHTLSPCCGSVLGSGRKTGIWSLITFLPSYSGHRLGPEVTVYRVPISLCSQCPHPLMPWALL